METVREFAYQGYWDSTRSWTVESFFKYLNQMLEKVPVNFRDTTHIKIDLDCESDIQLSISYERPKTQQDILSEARVAQRIREAKLAHYYRLKEELGL